MTFMYAPYIQLHFTILPFKDDIKQATTVYELHKQQKEYRESSVRYTIPTKQCEIIRI
jgi:hypothetical protein